MKKKITKLRDERWIKKNNINFLKRQKDWDQTHVYSWREKTSGFYVSVTAYQVKIYRMLEETLMKAQFSGRGVSKVIHQNYSSYHLAYLVSLVSAVIILIKDMISMWDF